MRMDLRSKVADPLSKKLEYDCKLNLSDGSNAWIQAHTNTIFVILTVFYSVQIMAMTHSTKFLDPLQFFCSEGFKR